MSSSIGQAPDSRVDVTALAEAHLRERRPWTRAQRQAAASVAAALVEDIPGGEFCTIGLAGAPGTGKSTLARLVCAVLEHLESPALVISLDDYYLGRRERAELSRLHPLFAQRGVPGTHDWATLVGHLERIREGDICGLRLPRFDKSRDDRCGEAAFRDVDRRPRVVILEGWLIGSPPQTASALLDPLNRLEAERDPNGRWRVLVNEQLAQYHRDLQHRLERRWFLAAPGWESVVDWRWQQEQEEPAERRHLSSRDAVREFLEHFQRISLHMLSSCRNWADVVVRLDEQHLMRVS